MSAGAGMPVEPTAAASTDRAARRPADTVADLVLTVLLLALFAWAYLETSGLPPTAALFPRMVTGAGFVLTALLLLQSLVGLRKERSPAPAAGGDGAEVEELDDDDAEYVFQTAGARRWAEAIGWCVGFFVLLYVAGLFVTAPVFSFLYLRFAGRRTWLLSTVYALVVGAVLYVAFELLLAVPTPPGLFLD
ncbi:Tripartite tricarboxylate transporter TctB family protein [Blastococcus sp. DSM 46786]|uniref:tripartite tricarboxylate transporter TctB family protein n=1 Tax=Blastococcus sp. DSM 46786 TaxID=1798227 RepID=UPI0008D19D73|nr:tripartite tricarboxylate transporter TctB family protein [Blastococcus sp. DSM 46786]SEK92896.1 Tripartite tricarboxylate transporter TctB family protein [Blastococcus sp. DSM 46786]